jgi:hypothetical protein
MTYWLVSSLISAYFTERFFIAEKRQSIIRNFLILFFCSLGKLIEIKGDKHPVVAFFAEELKQFTHHEFLLQIAIWCTFY